MFPLSSSVQVVPTSATESDLVQVSLVLRLRPCLVLRKVLVGAGDKFSFLPPGF